MRPRIDAHGQTSYSTLAFTFLLLKWPVLISLQSYRLCALIFRSKLLSVLLLLLTGYRRDYHFSSQRGKRCWYIDVFTRTCPEWVEEAVLLRKLLHALLGLQGVQLVLFDVLNLIHFVQTQHDRYGLPVDDDDLVNFLLPLRSVLYRLQVSDVSDHDHSLRLPAKVPIQALVTSIHSDQIPHLEPHIVPLHLQQLKLVVWSNRRLIVVEESVPDESIYYWSLANIWVAKHDYLESQAHFVFSSERLYYKLLFWFY